MKIKVSGSSFNCNKCQHNESPTRERKMMKITQHKAQQYTISSYDLKQSSLRTISTKITDGINADGGG